LRRYNEVAALLRSLGMPTPVPVQSMYMFKQPTIGDEVRRCRLTLSNPR
jgi:hypothetical protein